MPMVGILFWAQLDGDGNLMEGEPQWITTAESMNMDWPESVQLVLDCCIVNVFFRSILGKTLTQNP